ncbi:MAG: ABC transporter permease, partial [Acetobacteraceae bacterium]
MNLSPITRRRLRVFRQHTRGFVCFWIFLMVFVLSLFAELIANDRPLLVHYAGGWYVPVLHDYPETTFGSDFLPMAADYSEPGVLAAIRAHGWIIWPAIPYSYDTIVTDIGRPSPAPPSWRNPLGTDDQARDVLARVIYGLRLS